MKVYRGRPGTAFLCMHGQTLVGPERLDVVGNDDVRVLIVWVKGEGFVRVCANQAEG